MKNKCDKGYRGDCCCNCKFQVKINKHPSNIGFSDGSILETLGYGCEVFKYLEEKDYSNTVIFMNSEHGMCEMHQDK